MSKHPAVTRHGTIGITVMQAIGALGILVADVRTAANVPGDRTTRTRNGASHEPPDYEKHLHPSYG